MKNLRELFNLYHAGFQDFGPWLDHHREMHRRHPSTCPSLARNGCEGGRRWGGCWRNRQWLAFGRANRARRMVQAERLWRTVGIASRTQSAAQG